jgi:hypothetical protein
MGKDYWDASVEQQLVANAPWLILCQRSEESIVVRLKALELLDAMLARGPAHGHGRRRGPRGLSGTRS